MCDHDNSYVIRAATIEGFTDETITGSNRVALSRREDILNVVVFHHLRESV